MQDPAKEIDQMVRDMEDSAREARTEVAQLHGRGEAPGEAHRGADAEIKTWEDRADDGGARRRRRAGARRRWRRKGEKEAERAETQKALQEQEVYVDQLAVGAQGAGRARQGRASCARARCARRRAPPRGGSAAVDARPRPSTTSSACRARSTRSRPRRAWPTSSPGGRAASVDAERKLKEMSEESSSVDDALAELKKKLDNP